MGNKPLHRKKNSHPYKNLPLDIAIGMAGILFLGFIYSLSQKTIHTGVPIEVSFPEIDEPKMLAKELYNMDPIKDIKVEILNGGTWFTTIPEITVNSDTGIGANLRPVLKFVSVTEVSEELDPTQVIEVIDCIEKPLSRRRIGS